jgi:hypothetical protein
MMTMIMIKIIMTIMMMIIRILVSMNEESDYQKRPLHIHHDIREFLRPHAQRGHTTGVRSGD